MPEVKIEVVNKHHGHEPDGDRKVYIGRGSPLGNPFIRVEKSSKFGSNFIGNREEAIEQFRVWLMGQMDHNGPVADALNHIAEKAMTGGVKLICFCAPKHCHGDVIKQIITHRIHQNCK